MSIVGMAVVQPCLLLQEALFDAEGNMLPRENMAQMQSQLGSTAQTTTAPAAALQGSKHEGPAVVAKSAAATSSQMQPGSTSKASSSVALEQNSDKQKPKQGMLQLACFCFRPRTRSTEDPYPQESLRDRFAPKPDAGAAAAKAGIVANPVSDKVAEAISTKAAGSGQAVEGGAAGGGALKSKGGVPAGGLARGETAKPDWALKAEQHFEDAADADASSASDRHSTGEVEEVLEGPLQGAISLAPKHGLAAGREKSFSDEYEGSVGEAVPDAGASKPPSQPQQQLPVAEMSLSALAKPGVNHRLPPDMT